MQTSEKGSIMLSIVDCEPTGLHDPLISACMYARLARTTNTFVVHAVLSWLCEQASECFQSDPYNHIPGFPTSPWQQDEVHHSINFIVTESSKIM